MKNIKKFDTFINEGKISQFILKSIFTSIDGIKNIIKRLKGSYIPINFKNSKMNRDFTNKVFQLFDYTIFDCLKYKFIKKQREEADKISLSDLIEKRTGTNIYLLADSILAMLNKDNIEINSNNSIEVEKFLDNSTKIIKMMIGLIKRIDDEIEDEKNFRRELEELKDLFKSLDPRTIHKRDKEDTIDSLKKASKKVDDMLEPKEVDHMLDKISKYGMNSLTSKELHDLEKRSK